MKKYLLTLTVALFSVAAFAQPDVTNAYSANKNGDYQKAAEYIEKAMSSEKAIAKEKTWRYRGQIYLNVAQSEDIRADFPNALQLAKESFAKAIELDTRGSYERDNKLMLAQVHAVAMDQGIGDFETKNYLGAADKFAISRDITAMLGAVDTLAIWNTSLAYDRAGEVEKAIAGYRECAAMEYQTPNVYLFIANMQKDNGMEEDALATIKEAREKYPDNQALIIEELNFYLKNEMFEEAETNLNLASQNDADNEVIWFSLGTVYENLEKYDEATTAYQKAIDLKADYFEPNYNLGAMYFNKAVNMVNDANAIPPNQITKYKAAIAEANTVFEQALPYLESAYAVKPNDTETMRSLKDIYVRMGEDAKYEEIKKKLEGGE